MHSSKLILDFTIIPIAAGGIVWSQFVSHFTTLVPLLAVFIALGSVAWAIALSDWHPATLIRWSKGWFGRVVAAYRDWFAQLRGRSFNTPVWKLLRPRIRQVAVEMLFVSGLLVFSELLLSYTLKLEVMQRFGPSTVAYGFWSMVALVLLAPLVGIWRNCSALSLLLSEVWETHRLPRAVLENLFKSAVFLLLFAWIYLLLPDAPFARWGWLIIVAGAALIVARFSRELVYWHSHVQISMREALTDQYNLWMKIPASLGERPDRGNKVRAEVTVPLKASSAGQTLAALALPACHDCAIIAIERQGSLMNAPSADTVLCPGDKVLMEGPAEKIEAACERLKAVDHDHAERPATASMVLDIWVVSEELTGKTLAELDIGVRWGLWVVGLQRNGRRIINPSSDERLATGDEILIAGPARNLRRFHHEQGKRLGGARFRGPIITTGYAS